MESGAKSLAHYLFDFLISESAFTFHTPKSKIIIKIIVWLNTTTSISYLISAIGAFALVRFQFFEFSINHRNILLPIIWA